MTEPQADPSSPPTSPGVNNTTVWSDPAAGSQIDFARSCTSPRPRSGASSTSSSSPRVCGCASSAARSSTSTSSDAPTRSPCSPRWPRSPSTSASPPRSTPPSTSRTNSPASSPRLDHLTGGRAALERGHLARTPSPARTSAAAASSTADRRYDRAAEFLAHARRAVGLLGADDVVADQRPVCSCAAATPARSPTAAAVRHQRPVQRAAQPAGPPGASCRPATPTRAASSPRPRPTRSSPGTTACEAGQAFYARHQGPPRPATAAARTTSRSCPAATFVLGDTEAEAGNGTARSRLQQISRRRRAIASSSRSGTATCPATTPTGRCPMSTRTSTAPLVIQGRARIHQDPLETVAGVAGDRRGEATSIR